MTDNVTSSEPKKTEIIRGADFEFPSGYYFYPSDPELIVYFLRRKIDNAPLLYAIFVDVNLYEYHPKKLIEKYANIYKHRRENRWYFFTPRDRKYPNGSRPNRKTVDGYWKATGVGKEILYKGRQIGVRKALVFYAGMAGKGTKTNWIMYEYIKRRPNSQSPRKPDGTMKLDDWVLCTIQRKRGADNNKSYQPPKAEQTFTSQPTGKQKRAQDDQQQIQIQIQEDREIAQDQQIQIQKGQIHIQEGREVEPLDYDQMEPVSNQVINNQVIHSMNTVGCYGSNLESYNGNMGSYEGNVGYYDGNMGCYGGNNAQVSAQSIPPFDDFMGFTGSKDIDGFCSIRKFFQQEFLTSSTETNYLGCHQQMSSRPSFSLPSAESNDLRFHQQMTSRSPLNSLPTEEDLDLAAELRSLLRPREII